MIFLLSHIIILFFSVVVWNGCLRSSGAIPVVSNAVIELDTTNAGFAFSYSVVGGSSGFEMAVLWTEFGHEEPVQDGFWFITTLHNTSLIVRSLSDVNLGGRSYVAANFESRFSTDFAHQWMMIPMHRQLVINPSNPNDFVKDGILSITRSLSDNMLSVRVSVSILNSTQAAQQQVEMGSLPVEAVIHDFQIAASRAADNVPPVILRELHDELERLSIPCRPIFVNGYIMMIELPENLTDAQIESFPTIQYRVHSDSGKDAVIQLYGPDYVFRRSENDSLGLRIYSDPHANGFGLTTLSKIALFVDNVNRTIGFGEPL